MKTCGELKISPIMTQQSLLGRCAKYVIANFNFAQLTMDLQQYKDRY